MLLRVSSEAIGNTADLKATVGKGDGAVPHGALLRRFAEAACLGNEDLPAAREALRAAVGDEALVEAALTVGIFHGLVRTADGCGIPLDEGMREMSDDYRETLGLNKYAGARNTNLTVDGRSESSLDVRKLFR